MMRSVMGPQLCQIQAINARHVPCLLCSLSYLVVVQTLLVDRLKAAEFSILMILAQVMRHNKTYARDSRRSCMVLKFLKLPE
jgi:hypothetical protein